MAKNTDKNPYKELIVGMSDEDILHIVQDWAQKSDEFSLELEVNGKRNYSYFIGKYDRDINMVPVGKSAAVDNRIFSSIKAVVPYVTSKPAQPVCYSRKGEDNKTKDEESKFITSCTQEILKKIYEDTQVQKLNEQNSINRYLYKIGILRYGLRDEKIMTRVCDPSQMYFDDGAKRFEDSRYIGEPVYYTAEYLVAIFPKKEKEILDHVKGKRGMRVRCVEWWTEKAQVTTIDTTVVLNIKANPFLNDTNDILNYYKRSPIPYVALNVYNTGKRMLDDTSEIDLTYKLQDSINDITRAMIDNVRFVGSPIKVAKGFNQEQISKIGQTEPGDSIIIGENQEISYLQAVGMPPFAENTLGMLKNEVDSIFGTQATFRGEFEGVQSGVSRDILRQQAANSLAQLSRGIERMMDNLYRGWLHLILVYIDDPEFVKKQIFPILGDRTDQYVTAIMNEADGIEVSVLPGTILPDDPVTRSEQAMELANMNRITNEELYKALGIENPEEKAEALDLHDTITAIKAQELTARAQQVAAETQASRGQLDQINSEIDSLDAGDEGMMQDTNGWFQSPNAWSPTPAATSPVNISIGTPPENPAPNTPAQ